MSFTSNNYDAQEESMGQPDSGATDGSGGGNIPVWEADRQTQLRQLQGGGSVQNQSSFEIPNGVVDRTGTPYDNTFENEEVLSGTHAKGQALAADGKPLTGTARILEDGSNLIRGEKTVSGQFVLASYPPVGVTEGSDTEGESLNFRFSPSINGVAFTASNIGTTYDAGTFQYGEILGTVTDFNGDAVPNVSVAGQGAATITDENGDYGLVAPGGSTVSLTTLGGTYSFDVALDPGATKTENVQFPQLTIRVLDTEYEPAENVPVEIDGTTRYTGENGKVEIPTALVKSYEVTVLDYFQADSLTVGSAGEEWLFTVGPGASLGDYQDLSLGGVKIQAVDADTGRAVTDLRAIEQNTGVVSLSNGEGVCKLLSEKVGDQIDVQIGTGDKRYRTEGVKGTLPDSEMLEVEVAVQPETQVSNK